MLSGIWDAFLFSLFQMFFKNQKKDCSGNSGAEEIGQRFCVKGTSGGDQNSQDYSGCDVGAFSQDGEDESCFCASHSSQTVYKYILET